MSDLLKRSRIGVQDWWEFFFVQGGDGIRDYKVTGVQTCALPISAIGSIPIVGGVIAGAADFIITQGLRLLRSKGFEFVGDQAAKLADGALDRVGRALKSGVAAGLDRTLAPLVARVQALLARAEKEIAPLRAAFARVDTELAKAKAVLAAAKRR